ncbi:MAG: hypothetical protein KDD99_23430, partial [Bacteroidetes bacterium]|nr:hypothetical protein [Bacteroidota bacterium]
MDNPFLRFSLLILFFLFKFSSAFSQTQVNADITTPTTWTPGGSPYVVNTIIEVSSTLTIQAGVEVQYPAATMLEITGTLNVLGIKTDSVHFRSTGANPGAGIYFNGGSGSISHAIFDTLRQSASPTEGAAIYFKNANVSLDNCLVRGNMGSSRGLIYESGNVSIDSSSINTCVFGMIVKGGAPTVSNSSFTNNEDSDVVTYPQGVENFSNTQLDVIEITSTGSVTTKTFFPLIDSLETKYVLTNGLKITADTLFLDPGVTISFPGSEFLETSSSGVIWAVGNPQDTIRFLSTATGTNRGGIKIPSGKVRMSYTRIDDIIDGSTDYSAILVSGTGQLDYDHSLLKGLPQYSNSRGITFKGGNGQITESRIDSCNDGIFIWDGEPTITQCAFTNQSGADILTHPSGVSNVSNCDLQTVEFSMYFGQTNNVGSVPQTKSNAILPNINPLGTIYTMPSGLRIVDTLSLAPGVKMGFVNAGAIRVFGSGKLTAHGTKADSITFYSMNASPSFHGSGIWITNGEVDLAYCHFDKVGNTGGTNSSGGAVYFDGVNAKGTIRNSLFENGNYHGVRVNDGDVSVLNSTFIDFENGIYVDNGIPVLSN